MLLQFRIVGRTEWLAIMDEIYDRASPNAVWKVSGPEWVWKLDAWVCCLQAYDETTWWSLPFLVRRPRPVSGVVSFM